VKHCKGYDVTAMASLGHVTSYVICRVIHRMRKCDA